MKRYLLLLFAAAACSVAPSANNTSFYDSVRGKIYTGNVDYAKAGNTADPSYFAFTEDGYVVNAAAKPFPGFPWTWSRLYKIIKYQSPTRAVIQLNDPSWEFPWGTAPADIAGKDHLHVLEIIPGRIYRTEFGKFTTSGAWDGLEYSSKNLIEYARADNPADYPKILTIYKDANDFIGTVQDFDPKRP